ncbi:hypothetical protein AB0L10_44310, partial [Streptomyces flaveolus]|uniref:hypothetical protein n=1 Tax=Streptomyces flaveolus TaxID=67297 RepID=UPI003441A109
ADLGGAAAVGDDEGGRPRLLVLTNAGSRPVTDDLHRSHPPVTSMSTPEPTHTKPVTCYFTMHTTPRWRGSFTAVEFRPPAWRDPREAGMFWRKIRVPQSVGRVIVARMNVTGRSIIATARATSSPVAAV